MNESKRNFGSQSNRQWPVPESPWIFKQEWHQVLFLHWPFSYEQVQALLPRSLTLDTYDKQPWISIVAFDIRNFRLRALPAILGLSHFPEINLRTYVTHQDKPGIYAFSLDVNNLLTVFGAKWLFHLNYYYAQMAFHTKSENTYFSSIRRTTSDQASNFHASYMPKGEAFQVQDGTLSYWLSERYCIYSLDRQQHIYRNEIIHPAWRLQRAEIHIKTNTLGDSCGNPY